VYCSLTCVTAQDQRAGERAFERGGWPRWRRLARPWGQGCSSSPAPPAEPPTRVLYRWRSTCAIRDVPSPGASTGCPSHRRRRGNMVALLRSLGPGVLRFGGASADTRIAWTDRATPLPPWASAGLEASDLRELKRLADRSGWRVLLTIGLAHFDVRAAAREAAAAKAALGGALAGAERGHEPNSYAEHGLRTLPWRFPQYAGEARAYWRAIAKAPPDRPPGRPCPAGA